MPSHNTRLPSSKSRSVTKSADTNSSPLITRQGLARKVNPSSASKASNRTASGKRKRKRKARTEVLSSESSSSSDSDNDSDESSSSSSSSSGSSEAGNTTKGTSKKLKIQDTKKGSPASLSGSDNSDSSDEEMADSPSDTTSDSLSSSSASEDDSEEEMEGSEASSGEHPVEKNMKKEKRHSNDKSSNPVPSTAVPTFPPELRNFESDMTRKEFEDFYMKHLAEEFADELNALRQSKDFNDRSLPILVRALKAGVNEFDEDEMRAILGK